MDVLLLWAMGLGVVWVPILWCVLSDLRLKHWWEHVAFLTLSAGKALAVLVVGSLFLAWVFR